MRCLTLLTTLLLMISVGFAVVAWGFFEARLTPPLPISQPGATVVVVPSLPAAAPRPSVSPTSGEVVVELTEAELSQQLDRQLAGRTLGQTPLGPASFERVTVSLRSGASTIAGQARIGGASVPISGVMLAAPDGAGSVRITVSDAKIGGFPLPDAAQSELQRVAQAEVDRLVAAQRVHVRSLEIENGRLRAIGAPRR